MVGNGQDSLEEEDAGILQRHPMFLRPFPTQVLLRVDIVVIADIDLDSTLSVHPQGTDRESLGKFNQMLLHMSLFHPHQFVPAASEADPLPMTQLGLPLGFRSSILEMVMVILESF